MSITINLEPDVEARLRERAAQEGQTAEGLAATLLLQQLQDDTGKEPPSANTKAEKQEEGETLYDFLKDFIGSVDSSLTTGGEVSHLSENSGDEFTRYLEEKRRQGRL